MGRAILGAVGWLAPASRVSGTGRTCCCRSSSANEGPFPRRGKRRISFSRGLQGKAGGMPAVFAERCGTNMTHRQIHTLEQATQLALDQLGRPKGSPRIKDQDLVG